MTQGTLDFTEEELVEDVGVEELALFLTTLRRANDWVKAPALLASMRWAVGPGNSRRLRMLAEAAVSEVISGSNGYRHIETATPDEIRHFCAAMESRAKKILDRALRTRRRAHQLVG